MSPRQALALVPVMAVVAVAAVAETPREDPAERDCVTEFGEGISGRPVGLAQASDRKLWFTEPAEDRLGSLDPKSGRATEYRLPRGSSPRYATFGPDGRLWFTSTADRIGVFDTSSEEARVFSTGIPEGSTPHTPVVPGDGKLYFTYENSPTLGSLDLDGGEIVEIAGGLRGEEGLHGLTVDPSGDRLWATRPDADELVRFNLETKRFDRTIGLSSGARPHDVLVGPNGRIYLTLQGTGKIGEYDPATGTTRKFSTDLLPSSTPDDEPDLKLMEIASDESRAAIWPTSYQANDVYKLDLRERDLSAPVCNTPAGGSSLELLVAADGRVWYTDPLAGHLVRIDRESGS